MLHSFPTRRSSDLAVAHAPSVATELQRLADLRERGVLTEQEFQEQKARILGRNGGLA
jgi:hypothetical protein